MGDYAEYEIENYENGKYENEKSTNKYFPSNNKSVRGIINKFKLHGITDELEINNILIEFMKSCYVSKNQLKVSLRYKCIFAQYNYSKFNTYLSEKYPLISSN